MIEINLARQLQTAPMVSRESYRGYGWICAVLFLGIGVSSWWWTQIKEQEFDYLLQEKKRSSTILCKDSNDTESARTVSEGKATS